MGIRVKERETKILELLAKEKKLEVAALAQVLGVSSVTVRKDLDTLEEKGVLRREHGYALLKSEDDLSSRLAYHYACKGRIAKRAAALVADGETVMIESGSCCALLAEEICTSRRDVTIVTNSAFIAGFVRQKPHAHVVLLGGVYQNDAQVMVGPLVAQGAQGFFVNRLFIGTDGYTPRMGFTNSDHLRAQAVRDMAAQAGHVAVLTESEKFTRHGVVPLQLGGAVDLLVTDDGLPGESRLALGQEGVEILTVAREGRL